VRCSLTKPCIAAAAAAAAAAGLGVDTQTKASLFARLDLSFGLKALGRDLTSDVSAMHNTQQ
jgi:hypothetical protein